MKHVINCLSSDKREFKETDVERDKGKRVKDLVSRHY